MYRPRVRFRRRKKLAGKKLTKLQRKEVKSIAMKPVELKQNLVVMNALEVADPLLTLAVMVPLNFVIQGAADTNNRVGDQLYMKSFELRGMIKLNPQAQNFNCNVTCRMLVYQWHPYSIGTSPLTNLPLSDILENGPTGVVEPLSVYRWDTRQEYTILADRTYNIVGPGNTGHDYPLYQPCRHFFHHKISLKRAQKRVQYSTGGVNCTNNIVVYFFQYPDAGHATTPLTVFCSSRILFTDQ